MHRRSISAQQLYACPLIACLHQTWLKARYCTWPIIDRVTVRASGRVARWFFDSWIFHVIQLVIISYRRPSGLSVIKFACLLYPSVTVITGCHSAKWFEMSVGREIFFQEKLNISSEKSVGSFTQIRPVGSSRWAVTPTAILVKTTFTGDLVQTVMAVGLWMSVSVHDVIFTIWSVEICQGRKQDICSFNLGLYQSIRQMDGCMAHLYKSYIYTCVVYIGSDIEPVFQKS